MSMRQELAVASARLIRRLNFWIAISGAAAVLGFFVAQFTSDATPPYSDSTANVVAWNAFLSGALVFLVLCLVAVVQSMRRTRLEGQ